MEHLRLPKGFHVRDARFFRVLSALFAALERDSSSCGYGTVLLPVAGFASTFERGAATTGERTFTFKDRRGRRLMLSPDSTPSIFRWYLESTSGAHPTQVSWVAPLFRYRKVVNRAFHQFGVTFLNLPSLAEPAPDLHLAEATNFILRLYAESFETPLRVEVSNIGAVRHLLTSLLPGPRVAESTLSKLHALKDVPSRVQVVMDICPESAEREAVVALLRGDTATPTPEANSILQDAFGEMRAFGETLRRCTGVKYAPGNLHSSELLSGIGVRLLCSNGNLIGDGGRYDIYGAKFSERLKSVVSVGSGVESLFDIVGHGRSEDPVDFVLMAFLESAEVAYSVVEDLRGDGIRVRLSYVVGSVKKAIARAAELAPAFALLGQAEVERCELTVANSQTNERMRVPLDGLSDWLHGMLGRRGR